MIASLPEVFLPLYVELRNRLGRIAPLAVGLAVSGFFFSNPAIAQEGQTGQRFESQRVDLSRVMNRKPSARRSETHHSESQTTGERPESIRPVSHQSSPVVRNTDPIDDAIQQAGFFGPVCGPVCDCGACDSSCGAEVASCGINGPACGMETIVEGPACGVESCSPLGCASISCDGCDACGSYSSGFSFDVPVLHITWQRLELFAGVNGFKGPMNYTNTTANGNRTGDAGSFGFYEGFNEGRSLSFWHGWDMAWQFGARATQSNMSGTTFSGETRHQVFLTSGLFRSVDYGLQYGFVVDRLYGDWYYRANLTQIRTEISWKTQGADVFGFQFMAGSGSDDDTTTVIDQAGAIFNENITFEATDQYRFFYRRMLRGLGRWELFGGWTDNDDALAGAGFDLPINGHLTLNADVTYLNAGENDPVFGPINESWNIGFGFTYRPGGNRSSRRHTRPMFDVADNGTFLVDRL